jgi:hypothetical protein
MKNIIIFLLAIPLLTSCIKSDLNSMNRARKKMAGKYEITTVEISRYDTAGNVVLSSTINSPGNIELQYDKTGEEVFNIITYPTSLVSQTAVFGYIDNSNYKYWDADPSEKRFMLWCIGPGFSHHLSATQEKDGKNYTWTFIRSNSSSTEFAQTMDIKEVYKVTKTD